MNLVATARVASLGVLLLATAASQAPPPPPPPPASEDPLRGPDITVRVLDEIWRIGDEKAYTLTFDRAPLGRQAMRLVARRKSEDGGREVEFLQRITLDLRALGKPGALEHSGTIVYGIVDAGPYRYQESIRREHGYSTYRDEDDYTATLAVEIDPRAGTYRAAPIGASSEAREFPAAAGAVLADLLALGHWERAFQARETWRVGETVGIPLLASAPLPHLDFHLPFDAPRPVAPVVLPAQVRVEARETTDLFGVPAESFRCRVDPPGVTLWVSSLGGVLKFDTGRGLAGALEP
jgi:hypothetical protein